MVICIPPDANEWMFMLVLSRVILVLNSLSVGKMLANHIKVAINSTIFFIQFVQICLHSFFLIQKILYIDVEADDSPNVGKKRRRVERFIQEEGCLRTTTYPADISDILWERNMQQCTLERCQKIHAKLQRYLASLTLPAKSRKRDRKSVV